MDLHGIKQCISCYDNFLDLINFTQKEITSCYNIIADCDKAICDIRHYCELNYPLKPKQKTIVVKLLHNYSTKRREAKDTITVLKEFNDFLVSNKTTINKLNKIKCSMHSQLERISGERKYTPRILNALFMGNITGEGNADA